MNQDANKQDEEYLCIMSAFFGANHCNDCFNQLPAVDRHGRTGKPLNKVSTEKPEFQCSKCGRMGWHEIEESD
jgi:uncharacterized protein with PIN domain